MRVGWVVAFSFLFAASAIATPEVVTRPEPAPGPVDNPLKGWCPFTDAGPIRQPYAMVYLGVSWKELEPEEGRFAFERWEASAWSVPEAKGKHVVLRVYVDYPGKPSGMPAWLREKGVKERRYKEHGGGLAPDYDDPRMVEAMERLIGALGKRYDGDPRVGFIELGLLGFWGEWHTWPREELYASEATERRLIEAYRGAFPRKILLARYARDFAGRQDWLGFHDDMFPEDTDNGQDWSFLAGLRRSGRQDNWKGAAIGGEMVPGQARKWLGEGYGQTVRMVEQGHVSWVGPYGPALERAGGTEFRERSEALVRRMGYQLRLTEVRHPDRVASGSALAVAIVGENEGVAPFYYPWPAELALIDESGKPAQRLPLGADVRSWRPGRFEANARAEISARPGRYRLALGISDPMTGRPAIAFANALPRHEGWTVLGILDVGEVR